MAAVESFFKKGRICVSPKLLSNSIVYTDTVTV